MSDHTPAPNPDATAQPAVGAATAAAPQPQARPPRRRRVWLRVLGALLLVPLLLIGGVLLWAGSEGSLATTLRWLARSQPLQAEGVRGNLLSGGQAQNLRWQQDGLHIQLQDARLRWRPTTLWQRQLHITQLSAGQLHIDDQRPPSTEPAATAPPQSLALPLHIRVDALELAALHWAGPPAIALQDIAAQYRYDGDQHHLHLQQLRWQDGPHHAQAQAQASLSAHHPIALQLALAAQLKPGPIATEAENKAENEADRETDTQAHTPPPLHAQATLQGPLSKLNARALLRQIAPADDASHAALPPLPALDDPLQVPTPDTQTDTQTDANTEASPAATPSLHLQARLTPWAAQPLPAAYARLHAFDLAALAPLWPDAPHTQLSGTLNAQPQNPDDPAAPAQTAWAVQADIANTAPGPWDQARLPLTQLQTRALWHDGVAQVEELIAHIGQGRLQAQGHWRSADAAKDQDAQDTTPWRITAQLHALNPALLHTQLAPLLLDGSASAHAPEAENKAAEKTADQAPNAIDFQLDLQAREQASAPKRPATPTNAQQALLQLRQAATQGRWHDGLLTLRQLNLRTHDAQLSGQASLRLAPAAGQPPHPASAPPTHLGGQADLRLQIPGAQASVQGSLHHQSGQGQLQLNLQDSARALAWARQLPGAGDALADLHASGSATLDAQWQGGWQDPALQARLHTPRLDLRLPGQAAQTLATTTAHTSEGEAQASDAPAPQLIGLRNLRASLSGRLSQWQLDVQGQARQAVPDGKDPRQLDLRLAAHGARSAGNNAGKSLAASDWQITLTQLQASVQDPALLGPGAWQLALQAPPVTLQWSPAQGGRLNASAGQLHLSSPAPTATAVLAWQPLRWHAGQWHSAGQLRGLPLAWAERLSGQRLSDAGLSSDLVFDGAWDLQLTDTLRLQAHLARASGDLRLHGNDGQRLAAGVRTARLELGSQGPDLTLQLHWDTQHAGTAQGQLRTRLSRSAPAPDAQPRWHWPADAPLNGQLKASLPQLSIWSAFAPPGWRLNGAVQADLQIAGTRSQPQITGPLQADQLALRSVVDGIQLQNGHLRARLAGDRLHIDEFLLRGPTPRATSRNRSGSGSGSATPADGGHIRASGQAGWIDGRLQARLSATLTRLRASLRDDRQLTLSGQLQASLEARTLQFGGQLKVDEALILLPDDSAPRLGDDVIVRGPGGKIMYGKQAPATVADASASEPAAKTDDTPLQAKGEVRIHLGDQFRLQGLGLDTRLAGELTLSADGPATAMPRLVGTVHTVSGVVHAYGQRLDIQRGRITFTGDAANPRLDVLALRPNFGSDQRVGAQVQGTALLPHVSLYSQPALSESETLAWLLLGRAAPSTGAEAAMLQTAALALLSGRESKGLAASFGLDELSFARGDDGTFASASVTLGKRLSDRLYAAYEHSLAGTGGTLMVFYELSRRWSLRGQAGANMAVDLIFKLSF